MAPGDSTPEKTAPGALALVQRFVNSVDLESGEDELTSPQALRDWLAERGLMDAGGAPDALPAGRRAGARTRRRRGQRRAGQADGNRGRRRRGRRLVAPQGLPPRPLLLGLLRPIKEPLGTLVQDGGLRQHREGASLQGAAPRRAGVGPRCQDAGPSKSSNM